ALGRAALVVPTDITKAAEARRLAEATFERFGRIDVLVVNHYSSEPYEFVVDADIDRWREAMDINVVGTMAICKFVARYMVRAGRGSIINVTSRSMRPEVGRAACRERVGR